MLNKSTKTKRVLIIVCRDYSHHIGIDGMKDMLNRTLGENKYELRTVFKSSDDAHVHATECWQYLEYYDTLVRHNFIKTFIVKWICKYAVGTKEYNDIEVIDFE